jgi:YHS domain-containing protein
VAVPGQLEQSESAALARALIRHETAVTKQLAAETYYFCPTCCLKAFEQDPDRYIDSHRHPVERQVAHHPLSRLNL